VRDRFLLRKDAMDIVKDIKKGSASKSALETLEAYAVNDLVVRIDYVPVAKVYLDDRYRDYLKRVEGAYEARDIDALLGMKRDLYNDTEMLNKGELLTKIGIYLETLTRSSYLFSFAKWRDQIWAEIATEFHFLEPELRKSLTSPMQKQMRTKDSTIELSVTGREDDSEVSLDISGGNDAITIKDILVKAGVYHEEDLVPRKKGRGS
ncbi:MAG: hypothetical protein GYA24_17585, partial [Candidatus Lokiarchaeota archaeon]|nr:hypothetical protein [Candidatus Lokiarchaeota archaeon]